MKSTTPTAALMHNLNHETQQQIHRLKAIAEQAVAEKRTALQVAAMAERNLQKLRRQLDAAEAGLDLCCKMYERN